jgi:hypothetical protein
MHFQTILFAFSAVAIAAVHSAPVGGSPTTTPPVAQSPSTTLPVGDSLESLEDAVEKARISVSDASGNTASEMFLNAYASWGSAKEKLQEFKDAAGIQ